MSDTDKGPPAAWLKISGDFTWRQDSLIYQAPMLMQPSAAELELLPRKRRQAAKNEIIRLRASKSKARMAGVASPTRLILSGSIGSPPILKGRIGPPSGLSPHLHGKYPRERPVKGPQG